MLKFALVVILPLGIIFYGAYRPYLGGNTAEPSVQKNGILEKLIVANGSASIELDLNKLNATNIETKGSKVTRINFDAATDSFFSLKVFNGELRGPMPGSLTLTATNSPDVPAQLARSLGRLVLEKIAWGDYELAIRDAKSGFTFFNIEGHSFYYDPDTRAFSIKDGRLLLSKEFAEELGLAKETGAFVGSFSLTSSVKQIEIAEIVDGEVTSDTLPATRDPESGTVPGPDVIVGDLSGLAQFGNSANSQVGLAVGTDSCNFGTVNLNWFALPNNDHPVIPQNLYRLSGGTNNDQRFEQIAQSNVKHAFQALTENICNLGCNGVGDTHLGSGCSDPYVASLNAGTNNGLGSRAWINPFSGSYPRGDSATPPNTHTGHTHTGTSHRMLANVSDLNTSLNAGAKYYAEAQYITPHEYAWCQANPTQCNMYNNVSYRRFSVAGTTCANNTPSCYAFGTVAGEGTVRQQPAIAAWPGATRVEIRPDPGNDGIGTVAYKVTNPSAGVWHYEYAVYNQNLDRAIQSFSVPLGNGASLSNPEFHAPPQHPGWTFDGTVGNAGFSSTPWAANQTASSVTWSSETFAQNQNANAIRWGTLYNFRFDSNKPPQQTNATVGFFKTGAPINIVIQAPVDLATNLVVSGRVTTIGFRGVGNAKITISDGVNPPRVTYTNSFGFYRFDNVTGGTYTITAFKLRHTFSQEQLGIFSDASNLNFNSGQ